MWDSFAMIFATIYFSCINHNSIYWESSALIANILGVVVVALNLPESPKWLFEKNRFHDARLALGTIARANGIPEAAVQIEEG